MHVGFTGTQIGCTDAQLKLLRIKLARLAIDDGATHLHHGDCVGADAQAHAIAMEIGYRIVGHVPINGAKRAHCGMDETRQPLPYLKRNAEIVSECDVLVACPKEMAMVMRSGTWSTVRRAVKARKPVHVCLPDGQLAVYDVAPGVDRPV